MQETKQMNIAHILSDSWKQIRGFKKPCWGGLGFCLIFTLLLTLVSTVLALAIYPAGGKTSIVNYALHFLALIFLIPLFVGWALLPVHRERLQAFNPKRVFTYLCWHYMWRFYFNLFVCCAGIAVCMGAYILFFFLVIPDSINLAPLNTQTGQISAGIMLLLLFIFGTYFAISMRFVDMLIAEHNINLHKAWLKILKAVFKNYIKILAILIAIGMVAGIIGFVVGALASAFSATWLGLVTASAFAVLCAIWYIPWVLIVWGKVYLQLLDYKY